MSVSMNSAQSARSASQTDPALDWIAKNLDTEHQTIVVGACACAHKKSTPVVGSTEDLPDKMILACQHKTSLLWRNVSLVNDLQRIDGRTTSKKVLMGTINGWIQLQQTQAIVQLAQDATDPEGSDDGDDDGAIAAAAVEARVVDVSSDAIPDPPAETDLSHEEEEVPRRQQPAERPVNLVLINLKIPELGHEYFYQALADTQLSTSSTSSTSSTGSNPAATAWRRVAKAVMTNLISLGWFALKWGVVDSVVGPNLARFWQQGEGENFAKALLPFINSLPGMGWMSTWLNTWVTNEVARTALSDVLRRTGASIPPAKTSRRVPPFRANHRMDLAEMAFSRREEDC